MPRRHQSRKSYKKDRQKVYSPPTGVRKDHDSYNGVQVYNGDGDDPSTAYRSMSSETEEGRGHSPLSSSTEALKYQNYHPDKEKALLEEVGEEDEIYVVRQDQGYLSILFSVAQTVILGLMMWQCGIAPMQLNPMVGPYPDALSEWGGKNSPLIIEDGQWWRLLTPILLHAGIIHLAGNVAVQLEMGVFFEKEWGSLRWLVIYLGSGVGSSMLSLIFMPEAVSVGSSGAVMGLFGAKLSEVVLRVFERDDTEQSKVAHKVRQEQCCAVTCSVIVVLLFSFVPYVDWAAHLGGLLAGMAIGLMVFAFDLEYCMWKLVWLGLGFAITFAGFMAGMTYMYSGKVEILDELRDVCGYYEATFQDYECNCMRSEYFNRDNNNDEHDRLLSGI